MHRFGCGMLCANCYRLMFDSAMDVIIIFLIRAYGCAVQADFDWYVIKGIE